MQVTTLASSTGHRFNDLSMLYEAGRACDEAIATEAAGAHADTCANDE